MAQWFRRCDQFSLRPECWHLAKIAHINLHLTSGHVWALEWRHNAGDITLAGLPSSQHNRLQSVMNAAARLVFSARKSEHIIPLLHDLNWLRVPQRIEFKLAVLVYRCLHVMAPPYLARELRHVAYIDSRRRLRSASTSVLEVPSTRHVTIGDRVFGVAAARVWNTLPADVTSSSSLPVFKRHLKTFFFTNSHVWHCH